MNIPALYMNRRFSSRISREKQACTNRKKQQEVGKTQTHAAVSLQQVQHQRYEFVWVIVNRLRDVMSDYPHCDTGGLSGFVSKTPILLL